MSNPFTNIDPMTKSFITFSAAQALIAVTSAVVLSKFKKNTDT